ncbi:MAG TPA: hypothetical protein DDX37_02705 [Candidatus Omnitrophica bacterium]|nr:hypothetical protein [Candidatus Omnitrophota bacterium]
MSQVNTACKKCGFHFQWLMGDGKKMPDCPRCGFNAVGEQRDSGAEQLLLDLESPDQNKRNNAAVFLGERGEVRAVEPLLKIFKDEKENTPPGVLLALGDLKVEQAVGLIIGLMPDSDLDPKAHMLGLGTKTLAKIGTKEVLPTVLKNLRYLCVPWPSEVREAIKAFVAVGAEAMPLLIEGLELYKNAGSCSVVVRKEIIWALGEIGEKEAVRTIKAFLSDKNFQLAEAAKDALELLKWEPETDEDKVLYLIHQGDHPAIKAMGKDAIKPLVSMLMSGVSRKIKKDIANLLEELSWQPAGTEEKLEFLIAAGKFDKLAEIGACAKDAIVNAMMDDDFEDRLKMPEALVKIDDPGIYDVLLHAFKQVHCWELSRAAAKALGKLGDKRAIDHFIKDLKTSWIDEQLGCECANALGELSDISSIETLIAVSKKDGQYESLRDAALKAVEKIKKAHGIDISAEKDANFVKPTLKENRVLDANKNKMDCSGIVKVSCKNCNVRILKQTFDQNKGLCAKCAKDVDECIKSDKQWWEFWK